MKRSEINTLIRDADAFLRQHQFHLPPFAYWSPSDWRMKGPEAGEIAECHLGWDVTDFGLGDYARTGLLLFTIRNGRKQDLPAGRGKLYAEKVMVVDVDQVTPLHYHWVKTEDIINRGGGRLAVQLFKSTRENGLSDERITVSIDGVSQTVDAGDVVILEPGESITLTPRLYHKFWGEGERVLVGEVSLVNDDATDNHFHDPVGRFPKIEEDEAPLHLLVGDYKRYYTVPK